MSDDKREKLREYLRKNRPKDRVNLCNNSNDKENSNKNLEDDLNLDNEINSNKRDYDKEPLIIKNYDKFMEWGNFAFSKMFASSNIVLFWFLLVKEDLLMVFFMLFLIVSICIIFLYMPYRYYVINNEYKTVFYNNKICYYQNNKLLKETIFIDKNSVEIVRLFWNDFVDNKIPIFLLYGLVIFFSFKEPLCLIYFLYLIMVAGSYVLVKLFLHYNINNSFICFTNFSSVYLVDSINKKNDFYLYFTAKNDYKKLRKYFLYKFNIDLNNTKKDFFSMYN
ncbi:hypothetical protein [Campylobacter ureolyticus]|uniref:hypothetical protein n=1 Tax=Campylobacter ureolyticus TaxID=827 RepID=UPI0022B2BE52|nr:hypothetical protein [Campylobacter ureolyticus]MCZ6110828.1 hypothetical protein [Campylobacter ureolyticus]MDU5326613.1 hypothetical protein [Campylobacter ureolyticus]